MTLGQRAGGILMRSALVLDGVGDNDSWGRIRKGQVDDLIVGDFLLLPFLLLKVDDQREVFVLLFRRAHGFLSGGSVVTMTPMSSRPETPRAICDSTTI